MISSLVTSPNDRGGVGNMTSRAIGRVGQAVNVAVDRFVTVGETIADDNPEIKVDMYEACKEARAAGLAIEKLCETAETNVERPSPVGVGAGGASGMVGGGGVSQEYRATMIRAARCLLSSVTRVLLLADTVVVKQLLLTKDKVSHSLSRLESVTNFTEFVKAFSQFGAEMVELAQLTNDRQTDLKDERRRAQMAAARQVLDRSTMMLLTASKVCLRHPECMTSRENRDTVFCQMRRAMDLIHYVVKDGVLESCSTPGEVRINGQSPGDCPSGLRTRQDWEANHTVYGAVKYLEESVEMTRVTLCGPAVRERLCLAIDTISERSQDFTDSAYTSHEHRQTILLLLDRIRLELNHLLRVGVSLEQREIPSPSDELESAISAVSNATKEFKNELQNTALEQGSEIVRGFCEESELISALKNAGLATDQERLDEYSDRFLEHIEHMQEVCKLLRHVASTDSLQVASKYGEINLRIYGPQVVTAAQTLCLYPTSKIAKENVEVFADMWLNLVGDIKSLTKEIGDQILADNKPPETQVYMSLPRPGKHGTTTKLPKPTKLDQEEQAKLAKSGLDMKMISSEVDQEAEKWEEKITQDEDNDIVKRAKNMSSMAFSMYQFTRGEGPLKTTQDLFTQGEYFAEEANRLYKVVRQFSYQVPAGPQKKELMEHLDQIPTYVQTLQYTVKNPTVGKAATFTKVDNVIQETKNLMNVISKVVQVCFVCATKFSLKLPERLQLPTMDEVRSTGFSNPFGQVETTTSRDSFSPSSTVAGSLEKPDLRTFSSHMLKTTSSQQDQFIVPLLTRESAQQQIEQLQDNLSTLKSDTDQLNTATRPDCNVNPEIPPNNKAHFVVSSDNAPQMLHFQNCPVVVSPSLDTQPSLLQSQVKEQTTMQASLLQESQNSVSSLQNILNSLTLKYIQTQVSLEPLLDIQNTINFLKSLQNPQSSLKHEIEYKEGMELAINTLQNAQLYPDLQMQSTLEGTIQILQTLLLKHKDKSVFKCAEPPIINNESISRQYTLRTSSLDRKGKLHYNSTHSLATDKYPSLLTKALLDFKTLPPASHLTLKSELSSDNCHAIKSNQSSSTNFNLCLSSKTSLPQDIFISPPLSPAYVSNPSFFNSATCHTPYESTILSSSNHVPCSSNHQSNHTNQISNTLNHFQCSPINCSSSSAFNLSSVASPVKSPLTNSNNLSSNHNSLMLYSRCPPSGSTNDALSAILPHARELDIASSLCVPIFDMYSMQSSALNLNEHITPDHSPFTVPNSVKISNSSDQFFNGMQDLTNVANTGYQNPHKLQKPTFTRFTDLYSFDKRNSTLSQSNSLKSTDQLQYLDLHTSIPESLWLTSNPQNSLTSHSELNQANNMLLTSIANQDKYNSIYTTTQPSLSQSVQFNIQSLYKDLNFHSLTP